jgi:hypothetical protein
VKMRGRPAFFPNRGLVVLTMLALAILVTRSGQFAAAFALADATPAAFFVSGCQIASAWAMLPLFAAAAIADQLAFANGVSNACMTPAYAFLVPAYAVLWSAGRRSRAFSAGARWWPRALTMLAAACVVAWFIANGSFYALSDRYAQMAPADYFAATLPYLAPYVGWTVLYGMLALIALKFERASQPVATS